MTEGICNYGRVKILDSGFCILRGIVELSKVGLFVSELIKKRRYCPKHIKGEAIKAQFDDRDVDSVDVWPRTMDGQRFHIFSMKEPNYLMNLMSSYGTTNLVPDTEKNRVYKDKNGKQVTK